MRPFTSLWDLAARHPRLAALAAVIAQTALTLHSRALWFSDEVRYANAYENMERAGHWIVLSLNGVPYPDKPPVYFWFLSLLDHLTPLDPPAVFFLGAALSGLFFLWAVVELGRALGLGRNTVLAAVLVVASSLFFAAVLHYSRMDLLFAALIVLSQAFLARTFAKGESGAYAVLGLALAGLAVLVKGPLGLIFPMAGLAAFLAWSGRLRRLFSAPVGLGLLAAAGVCSLWVAAAWVVEGGDFVRTVFVEQIFQRATNTFHHKEGPAYYFLVLPAIWVPWTFFALAPPLTRLFSRAFWSGAWAARREEAAGPRVWLWALLLSAFGLLSCLSGKVVIYLLPLFAPLALLTADALFRLGEQGRARGFAAMAAFLLLAAGGLPLVNRFTPLPVHIEGLPVLSVVLALTGAALLLWRRGTRKPLAALALGVTVFMLPASLITAPSLDAVMSPRETALLIGGYMDRGYAAAMYDTYPGIYTYYAGHDILEVPKHFRELDELCATHERVVIAMKKKHLRKWTERPEGLKVVHEQWIADQPYILLVQEP
ncbi:MAG: ArnT family glycosyltransferase [Desulfovibrionaceae bacterium]